MDTNLKAANPAILRFDDKQLFLFEKNISEDESLGLKKYLKVGKENVDMQIRSLIIDSCLMQDNVL